MRYTVSMLDLIDEGVQFRRLPGWVTLPEVAKTLEISYQGAVHLVLDQQVFNLETEVCLVGARTLLVCQTALDLHKERRAADGAAVPPAGKRSRKANAEPAVAQSVAEAA